MKKLSRGTKRILFFYAVVFLVVLTKTLSLETLVGLLLIAGVPFGVWVGYKAHEDGESL